MKSVKHIQEDFLNDSHRVCLMDRRIVIINESQPKQIIMHENKQVVYIYSLHIQTELDEIDRQLNTIADFYNKEAREMLKG